jgi:hypothetical protein
MDRLKNSWADPKRYNDTDALSLISFDSIAPHPPLSPAGRGEDEGGLLPKN